MFNSFKISNFTDKYAHSKEKNGELVLEPFIDHCDRTEKYFKLLCLLFNIEEKLKKILEDFNSNIEPVIRVNEVYQRISFFIKYHDIGKLDSDFQKKLKGMQIAVTHSDKSFYVLVYFLLRDLKRKEINSTEYFVLFLFLYSVYKHHGKLNNVFTDFEDLNITDEKAQKIKEILLFLGEKDFDVDEFLTLISDKRFWQRWNRKTVKDLYKKLVDNSFAFFIFLKLFHSLLISADYYATYEFETGKEFKFEVFDINMKKEVLKNFFEKDGSGNFNVKIEKKKPELRRKYEDISGITDINEIRSILNVISEDNLLKYLSDKQQTNAFLLNIPTGGGKTNISLRLALNILKKDERVNKIFYVFPFINLIEQSYDYFINFLGREDLTRLDSRYIDPIVQEEREESEISLYTRYVDKLFFNKPFLLTSHVKFFDLFFRNDKNSNYNFYQLSNSIVIIDEIQAYDYKTWTEIAYLISEVSKYLGTYFIIMSATLPDIHKLVDMDHKGFHKLLPDNFIENVFKHPVFKRTEIIFNKTIKLQSKSGEKKERYKKLKKEVIKSSRDYDKILVVFNKIKDSYEFYKILQNENKLKMFDIVILNSTILNERRKKIIEMAKESTNKMILISTQAIEAGVDIDFDIGFRAFSPIDNIIQVAGRINRNNQKDVCKLVVFDDEDYKNVYGNNIKTEISDSVKKEIIEENGIFYQYEVINNFYERMIEVIVEENKNPFLVSSSTNLWNIRNLYFRELHEELDLIKGDTISLFIPINLEAQQLWKEYMELIDYNRDFKTFLKIKEKIKTMGKYVINIFDLFTNEGRLNKLLKYELQYGFYYCDDWQKYYSLEDGLNIDKFIKQVHLRGIFI